MRGCLVLSFISLFLVSSVNAQSIYPKPKRKIIIDSGRSKKPSRVNALPQRKGAQTSPRPPAKHNLKGILTLDEVNAILAARQKRTQGTVSLRSAPMDSPRPAVTSSKNPIVATTLPPLSVIHSWPVSTPKGKSRPVVTDGYQDHILRNSNAPGCDIDGKKGDPVWASADGIVIYQQRNDPTNGNWVVILHDDGSATAYLHLLDFDSRLLYKRVRRYQRIGRLGNSGSVRSVSGDGSHLHYTHYKTVAWAGPGHKPSLHYPQDICRSLRR